MQRFVAPEKSHLLICKSNATRLALDAEVRRRLRDHGVLTGDNVAIDASTASDSECVGCSQFPPNMANSAPRCWAQ
jgi:hypothetical protein